MIIRQLSLSLAIAVLILAVAAMLRYGQGTDLDSHDAARRTMQVFIGLVLAVYGNYLPKETARSACALSRRQSALRVAGWSLALAGLGHAGFWAFAPIPVAAVAAKAVVLAATLITMGYGGWILLGCRGTHGGPV